jgi:hypothetical protein
MKNHSTQRETMLGKTASYINRHHLALVALFFALGGTSFAAGNALLPGNSVGTKQVINGSLQTKDLSKTARSALKGNRGLRGPAGAQGAQGATGAKGAQGVQGVPGQSATKLFVALDADGTLTKNSGATLATKAGTGVYRIAFNTDITNCVYLGSAGQNAGGVSGDYNLFTSRTNTSTVNVAIFDETNTLVDLPFNLAVFC